MIFLWLTFLLSSVRADAPLHWNQLSEIRDRHEFYANNEMIVKPKESWQTLFSVVYTDIALVLTKDCVFYRVPGESAGVLKLKSISAQDDCDKYILSPGDKEWKDVRSLQFSTSEEKLTLDMTFPKYQNEKWQIGFQNKFVKPDPKMHLSSSEYKAPKIFFLSPKQIQGEVVKGFILKPDALCHEINDDCEEIRPSVCSQCPEGWYEIPNGCMVGPKYCGRVQCGMKNAPACRRGMMWQREERTFDCRTDSSFAYCSQGLTVQCQGKQAWCR